MEIVTRVTFSMEKRHGEGKSTRSNGESYEGDYAYGKQHGEGKRTWSDGTYYDGEWMNG